MTHLLRYLQGLKASSESGAQFSRFKDLSLDGLMEDFLDDSRNRGEEASTSAGTSLPPTGNSIPFPPNKAKLKSQVSQKQVKLKTDSRRKSRSDSFRPLVAGDENEFDIIELVQPSFLTQLQSSYGSCRDCCISGRLILSGCI